MNELGAKNEKEQKQHRRREKKEWVLSARKSDSQ